MSTSISSPVAELHHVSRTDPGLAEFNEETIGITLIMHIIQFLCRCENSKGGDICR